MEPSTLVAFMPIWLLLLVIIPAQNRKKRTVIANKILNKELENKKMFELAKEFVNLKTDTPKLFYIWGHAYEFDIHDTWSRMEEFCRLISGHSDIFYGTNREVLL